MAKYYSLLGGTTTDTEIKSQRKTKSSFLKAPAQCATDL